jgi:CheY-like chemotaxis protein
MKRKRILVAEDNAALASVIRFNLQRVGCEVTVAHDGYQGWEHAREQAFDLVVTDQQMPRMSGAELCRLLRQTPDHTDTPIIMLTAKGLELELPRLREELGIAAVFLKPFSPREVVKAVEDCLTAAAL